MQKMADMARFMVFAGCACVLTATAFPPRMELDKAEKIVTEIMSSDVAAFKAKGKSAADVASAALKYADEANGEAARFLLLKGAFVYQVRAQDYDGAKATIGRIRAEIDNVPDKVVADMLASSLRRVPRKHCGQLFDLLQRTQNRVKYTQELQTLAPKAKAAQVDRTVHARMGELHALLGDWKRAAASFAAVGAGKRADIAAWEVAQPGENKKFDAAKAADFWWDEAANAAEDLAAAYRVHAAYWYRRAIKDDALPGLKKPLAEKRISEAEKDMDMSEAANAEVPVAAAAKGDPSQPPPRTLKLGRGADIEFVGCPAGSFMMGNKFVQNRPRSIWMYHKVNFTRPFWLSKFKVTHGMWNAYKRVNLTKEDQVLGGMNRVHFATLQEAEAFCEWATKRFRSNLPPGYVVRFPTNAEWEYAYRANVTDETDPYVQSWARKPNEVEDLAITVSWDKEVFPKLNAAGVKFDATRVFGAAVGTKRPNAWGLYDMVGNGSEYLLDRVDCGLLKDGKGVSLAGRSGYPDWFDQDAVRIEETETDPLWWCSGEQARNLKRGSGARVNGRWTGHPAILSLCFGLHPFPFRLCIGPDLVKEKGFKK